MLGLFLSLDLVSSIDFSFYIGIVGLTAVLWSKLQRLKRNWLGDLSFKQVCFGVFMVD
ncbi:hypothetical protein HanXRQr2_Chr14g0669991 [Helianthus annuus]|uniref:Uncharacterized protein n=1 Tax=Helianthus annuus TaxID=4232 RepID=A0A9K3ED31_HELAN|nr:hypothetical protein HanXRQr2_Chr14g0669991 [Helianthus annuus]